MLKKKRDIEDILREIGESQRKSEENLRKIEESQRQGEENRRKIEESQRQGEENLRKLEESQRKTQESLCEAEKAADKTLQAVNKACGEFTNKWGRFMENLIQGDVIQLLQARGLDVDHAYRPARIRHKNRSIKWDYDLIAANGEEVVVIEVKTTLSSSDVDYFLRKLADFKKNSKSYRGKTIYGAMAYLEDMGGGATKYAQKMGLFTIEALGATEVATITNAENFKPKMF